MDRFGLTCLAAAMVLPALSAWHGGDASVQHWGAAMAVLLPCAWAARRAPVPRALAAFLMLEAASLAWSPAPARGAWTLACHAAGLCAFAGARQWMTPRLWDRCAAAAAAAALVCLMLPGAGPYGNPHWAAFTLALGAAALPARCAWAVLPGLALAGSLSAAVVAAWLLAARASRRAPAWACLAGALAVTGCAVAGARPHSLAGRRLMLAGALDAVAAHPWTGAGLGSAAAWADRADLGAVMDATGAGRTAYRAHCEPLQAAGESGLPAAACFALFWLAPLRRRPAFWLPVAALALVSFPLQLAPLAVPLWARAGIDGG